MQQHTQNEIIRRIQRETSRRALQTTRAILDLAIGSERTGNVNVRLWDGTLWPDESPRAATFHLKHAGALRAVFLRLFEIQSCEAFIFDDFDIVGDGAQMQAWTESLQSHKLDARSQIRVLELLLRLPPPRESRGKHRNQLRRDDKLRRQGCAKIGDKHSLQRDQAAIRSHYDVSNEFYQLFLDPQMVYSCAYFHSKNDSLEVAQTQKLDLICRKLRLQRGQKMLDIGCGWGALVIHAAKHYGVDATGVTISVAQAQLARERIAREGLSDQVQVLVQDYREVEDQFDAIASIGMCEHLGASQLPIYFQTAWKLLRDGGVFLNHGIANRRLVKKQIVPSFTDLYVFPDSQLVPISWLLQEADAAGFEVRDVENLREHYAKTLAFWLRNLEDNREWALQFVSEETCRVWRLYLAASGFGFSNRVLAIYQTLLVKNDGRGRNTLPLSRDDWFESL